MAGGTPSKWPALRHKRPCVERFPPSRDPSTHIHATESDFARRSISRGRYASSLIAALLRPVPATGKSLPACANHFLPRAIWFLMSGSPHWPSSTTANGLRPTGTMNGFPACAGGTRSPEKRLDQRRGLLNLKSSRAGRRTPGRSAFIRAHPRVSGILRNSIGRSGLFRLDPFVVLADQVNKTVRGFGFGDVEFHRCFADVKIDFVGRAANAAEIRG